MKIIIQLLIIISILSCKEEPSYNPFDNQFNVSVNSLIRDNCDIISIECGYANLSTKEGKLKPYYQIYLEDFDRVVAKGFNYEINTFNEAYSDDAQMDSLINLPIDGEEMDTEFGKFGYRVISRNMNTIQIFNSAKNDTIELYIEIFPSDENTSIVRRIQYFKSDEKKSPTTRFLPSGWGFE